MGWPDGSFRLRAVFLGVAARVGLACGGSFPFFSFFTSSLRLWYVFGLSPVDSGRFFGLRTFVLLLPSGFGCSTLSALVGLAEARLLVEASF